VWNGECYLSPEAGDLKSAQFPDNLEAVITSRIDRLAPQLQLVLKVGRARAGVLAVAAARDLPDRGRPRGAADDLASLERRGLVLAKGGSAADPHFTFKHTLTQEVAYNLLPFSQRQQLHQAVAEYFEEVYQDRVELYYPLLASHWYRVVAPGRAGDGGAAAGARAGRARSGTCRRPGTRRSATGRGRRRSSTTRGRSSC
jgi:hypothetical protein